MKQKLLNHLQRMKAKLEAYNDNKAKIEQDNELTEVGKENAIKRQRAIYSQEITSEAIGAITVLTDRIRSLGVSPADCVERLSRADYQITLSRSIAALKSGLLKRDEVRAILTAYNADNVAMREMKAALFGSDDPEAAAAAAEFDFDLYERTAEKLTRMKETIEKYGMADAFNDEMVVLRLTGWIDGIETFYTDDLMHIKNA